jgi:hypothetical protein
MKAGARLSLFLGIVAILGACGVPTETGDSLGPTTTTPPAEPEEPAMEIVSVTACKAANPWTMVETAFKATVTAIEARPNPEREAVLEEVGAESQGESWQWVSFDVSNWHTTDYGTSFSMWAPNFGGAVGEEWLIAGALYHTLGQQSGEVFPCISTPSTDRARQDWEDRLGSPVPAGSGVPESQPDPALVAQIEEQRTKWLASGIDDYTTVISVYSRDSDAAECGGNSSIRVIVEDGVPTEAIDVMRFCTIDDPTTLPVIDDLFDLALVNAGAIADPIEFDPGLGYIRSFYASDRSVEAGAYVEMLQPRVIDAALGTGEAMEAVAAAEATWEAAGIDDYTFELDVICFCTISGRFQVAVANSVATTVESDSGPIDLAAPDRFMDYNVEGLFALVTDWGGGQSPDSMLASFDPELGYPVEIRIDSIHNAVDDELTFFVSDFEISN